MDIRKFFGPQGGKNQKAVEPSKGDNKTTKSASGYGDSGSKGKTSRVSPSPKRKQTAKSQSPKKKPPAKSDSKKSKSASTPVKKAALEQDDTVVIDDDSEDEVIKNSQSSVTRSRKVNGFHRPNARNTGGSEKDKQERPADLNIGTQEPKDSKKSSKSENEIDLIEIESVKSSDSKDSQRTPSQGKKGKGESKSDLGKKKKSSTNDDAKIRRSPRKNTTGSQEETKKAKRKRKQISSDEDDDCVEIESEEEESEEVIKSRRSHGKGGAKQSKRMARVLESDSDEDPMVSKKPKTKRKKKEQISFVEDSDEEKNVTALDKFVLHNVKSSGQEEKKTSDKKKEETTSKKTPVNVQDFFGTGVTSRSDRTTAVAKRKHEESETVAKTELTFDEEMHDDEDFLQTLDQLDGPDVKKTKQAEDKDDKTKIKTESGSTLAGKLAGKMKQQSPERPSREAKNANTSAISKSPVKDKGKSPAKTRKASPTKKGSVYSMEVTRTPSKAASVTPNKKEAENVDKTPQSKAAKTPPKRGNSSEKKAAATKPEDDGFGTTKAIGGFRAFKARGGPLALGSKEIPEGAENCLEGLTFVITGVLDSIERDDAKAMIEKHGGKVTGSISRKTSYVVVGREAGESKLSKARDLKVEQLDEDKLFDLVRTLPGKTSKYEIQAKEQLQKEASLKVEKEKAATAAAKKLESFGRGSKPGLSSPSAAQQGSLFTQIKDSSNSGSATSKLSTSIQQGQSQSSSHKSHADSADQSESLLWVDKHKPTSLKQIIGQQGDKSNARKLLHWLTSWHTNVIVKGLKPAGNFFGKGDGTGCRAALLSGPPGIGKTTTATIVCQEAGFSFTELNASVTRSKKSLKDEVMTMLGNQTLTDSKGNYSGHPVSNTHCLIMDEVDGMAGNEDRGGLQELVQLIKNSKIPIICICNDRNSMKMRTLSNYCFDLRFQRPRLEQIKGSMMSIAFKEGLKIPPAALNEIIQASNHDIRQIIHNMSMWSATDKNLTFEQVKADAQKAQKDLKLGPFDVVRKVFVNDDETRKMSINDKSDLFFHDYSFGPLFVHENYPHIIPLNARGDHSRHMSCLARTINSISDGDLVDKLIRKEGNWNLLPTQAMFSSVIPGEIMRGSFPQMPEFPQWLGKFSSTNKTHRILQELSTHMRLEISCDKRGLTLDYLPALRACLTSPLVAKGSEGVPEVIKVMDDYDIIKEDFDNILDVTKWPNSFDPMAKLEPKTKAAFTRQYNKEIHATPYATGVVSKKRRRGAAMEESDYPGEEGEDGGAAKADSEDEEDESLEADTMIKAKKPPASKKGQGQASSQASTAGKGKGKGKGKK